MPKLGGDQLTSWGFEPVISPDTHTRPPGQQVLPPILRAPGAFLSFGSPSCLLWSPSWVPSGIFNMQHRGLHQADTQEQWCLAMYLLTFTVAGDVHVTQAAGAGCDIYWKTHQRMYKCIFLFSACRKLSVMRKCSRASLLLYFLQQSVRNRKAELRFEISAVPREASHISGKWRHSEWSVFQIFQYSFYGKSEHPDKSFKL